MAQKEQPNAENKETNDFNFDEHQEVVELKKKLEGMSKDAMKKYTDSIRVDISQLSSKIDQLKKTRADNNAQARHYRNMRNNVSDEKFSKIEQLREEAAKEKDQRDYCNEQIKLNKAKREELKEEIRAAWAKVKDLREKYYKMKDEVGVMPEEITKEIRELEWQQQTSTLSPDDDAQVTKRITELYEKAYSAHIIGYSSEDLENTIEIAKTLSEQHDNAHQNVLKFAEEGQIHHERLTKLYDEINEARAGGSGLHDKFLEARQAADTAHQKIVELYEKIKLNQHLLDLIDDEQVKRRHEKSQKLREEKIQQTKQKQSSSKRMTLEELKLLMGSDDEEEN